MIGETISVYVKLDTNNVITDIDSSIFIKNYTGYTKIDEGQGDKYSHAQGMYLPGSIRDTIGRCNFKFVDNAIVELTEEEKLALNPPTELGKTAEEVMEKRVSSTEAALNNIMAIILG